MGWKSFSHLAVAACLGGGLFVAAASVAQSPRPVAKAAVSARAEPVVVELFTAQGCDGCPQANERIEALADRSDVLVLTYPVDYWDYTGWTDTLARPEFGERQQAYRQPLRLRAVATPQVILDGHRAVPPHDEAALGQAVDEEAARLLNAPEIEFRATGDRVGIGSGRAGGEGAEVLAVIFRPGPVLVRVEGGDNRGRVVRHVNVVREIRLLGRWVGRPILLALPGDLEPEDRLAILVQSRADRQILVAAVR